MDWATSTGLCREANDFHDYMTEMTETVYGYENAMHTEGAAIRCGKVKPTFATVRALSCNRAFAAHGPPYHL